jgi:hypothetical protein
MVEVFKAILFPKRLLICLLAAIVLIAFADRQPDPPALAPHPDKTAVFSVAAHPFFAAVDHGPLIPFFSATPMGQITLSVVWFFSDGTADRVSVCRHSAADSSPPDTVS